MLETGDKNSALRQAPSGEPARVLVVDDEPLVRRWVERVLVDAGYLVDSAVDGAAAVLELERNPYELVLTDVTMPRVDGLGVLAASVAQDPTVPVILMTGAPQADLERRAVSIGAAQVLLKPMPLQEIVEVVGRFVRLRRLQAIATSLCTWRAEPSGAVLSELARAAHSREVRLSALQLVGPRRVVPSAILLDPELVRGIDQNQPCLLGCRALLGLCAEVAIDVIALGVESESEANALRELGCERFQD